MPHDESPRPWGIQTDIVSVGGSSGSPILDPSSREIIGMAQHVIATMTTVDKEGMPSNLYELTKGPLYGVAPLGLAYGVTKSDIITASEQFEDYFEGGLPPDIFDNTEILRIF